MWRCSNNSRRRLWNACSLCLRNSHTLNQTLSLQGVRGLYVTKDHSDIFSDRVPVQLQMKVTRGAFQRNLHLGITKTHLISLDLSQMLKLFYLLSFLRPCQVIRFCQGRHSVNILKSSTSALPGIIWQEMITDLFWAFLSEIAFPIFTTIGLKTTKVISGSRQSIIIQCSVWIAFFFFFSHSTPTYIWPIIVSPWSVEYFIHVFTLRI